MIEASPPDTRWFVVSLGRPPRSLPNTTFITIPSVVDYGRVGVKMARRGLLALNLLYMVPLVPVAAISAVVLRPDVAIGNGPMSVALLLPARLVGARLRLVFHGYLGHVGGIWRRLVSFVLSRCDLAFVNSRTSRDDLSRLMKAESIREVAHWADARFFEVPLARSPSERLRILFVGRLDDEKFSQCLRVSKGLAEDGTACLVAAGGGPLAAELQGPFLEYAGYLTDREAVVALYAEADVVWAPADTTYVSRPGIEGLAAGCPIVVGDTPAVTARAEAGERIPRTLLPSPVGYVVDGAKDDEAERLLRQLHRDGLSEEHRARCRAYARENHGPDLARDVALELVSRSRP